jgi:hypothetical protein
VKPFGPSSFRLRLLRDYSPPNLPPPTLPISPQFFDRPTLLKISPPHIQISHLTRLRHY